jgi:hypothetical protein
MTIRNYDPALSQRPFTNRELGRVF